MRHRSEVTVPEILREIAADVYQYNCLTSAKRLEALAKQLELTTCCCICNNALDGHGNNPWPVKFEGRCCDVCNMRHVVPARIALVQKEQKE